MTCRLAIAISLLLAATSAHAVDGVIEINQGCVPVGCFPGDLARMPVTITAPGSYRLTSNLTGEIGVNAIEISIPQGGPGVTLDLNGFEIAGVPGSLDGIRVMLLNTRSMTVRNGTVRDFGGDGVNLAQANSALVEGVHARENGGRGIASGRAGVVRASVAWANGDRGISVNEGGLVESCVAEGNTGAGIYAYGGSVRASTARSNAFYGIQAYRSSVSDSSAQGNALAGFLIDEGNLVDSTSIGNPGGCISVFNRSRVAGNTCTGTGPAAGAGITVDGSGNRIDGNNTNNSSTGISVTGTANLVIRNSASGNGTNYSIGAGNTAGPVVTSATIGASSNPHANYAQ
jgi:hypothetical protein